VRPAGRGRGDAGFVSAWTVVIAVACWAMVGLVVDGGRALRERSSAFGAAAAAGRAGVQEIDERAAALGSLELDEEAAENSAREFLHRRGFDGTVIVDVDGLDVIVTVKGQTEMTILAAPRSVSYAVTATARAVQGDGPI
jgi:Putative Flp pilus-assembly TadE/G-like